LWICAVADSGPVSASVLPMRTGACAWTAATSAHIDKAAMTPRQKDFGFIMEISSCADATRQISKPSPLGIGVNPCLRVPARRDYTRSGPDPGAA
jgi:hypothetical protein